MKKGKRKVVVKLPRPLEREPNYITASVNGKVYKIQKGVNVEVPEEVAEVIANSDLAAYAAMKYIDGLNKLD